MDKLIVFQILSQNLRKIPRNIISFKMDDVEVTFTRSAHPSVHYFVDRDNGQKKLHIFSRGSDGTRHLVPSEIYFRDNFERDKIFDIFVKSLERVSDLIEKNKLK